MGVAASKSHSSSSSSRARGWSLAWPRSLRVVEQAAVQGATIRAVAEVHRTVTGGLYGEQGQVGSP